MERDLPKRVKASEQAKRRNRKLLLELVPRESSGAVQLCQMSLTRPSFGIEYIPVSRADLVTLPDFVSNSVIISSGQIFINSDHRPLHKQVTDVNIF